MVPQAAGELGRRLARGALVVALSVAMGHGLDAQTSAPASGATVLDRPLVLHVRGLSLRDAIDRIAAAAGLRISYSADVLPLDRAVRAAPETGTVGGLLGAVLAGVAVRPVVAGSDQVVLAPPGRAPREGAAGDTAMVAAALDRVVVTGSTAGRIERALTLGTSVIEGRDLAATGARNMAAALDLVAPGVWVWPQSPTSVVTRFGSIRGASSFGANSPKVYVDGIAVANPLLVAGFDPENIQRIEVIRGPQGAALYGADAISGVVNIVTRRDLASSGERIRASSDAEVVSTNYAPTAAFGQSHRLGMDLGTPLRSAQVSVGASNLGALYPGATSGSAQGSMTARLIGARTSFTGTARFYDAWVGAASNPVLATPDGAAAGAAPAAQPQSLREYTVGGTIQHAGLGRWSQTAVLGVNGYVLNNVANDFTPFPSSADSALRAARGAALRTTLRMSTTARFGDDAAGGAITLAAEHSALRQQTADIDLAWEGPTAGPTALVRPRSERWWALGSHGGDSGTPASAVEWVSDAGVLAQADLAFHDTWFVTAGARVERNDGYLTSSRLNALPSLGAAWVGNVAGATVKLRAAYGRGMRAPRSAARETLLGAMRGAGYTRDLGPEEQ
ncbi:MAG: TonB-dependent receptor, partial [Gemmatimonadota bacterium]|nr:TonB-dependent receptor [Gemmatimonadota bacterium]